MRFDFCVGVPGSAGARMARRCTMRLLYTSSGLPSLIPVCSACQLAHRLLTLRPTASPPPQGRCKVVASMHSRAPPIVGRARRLTDTVGDDTIAAAKARAAGSLGGAHGGIPAGIAAGHDGKTDKQHVNLQVPALVRASGVCRSPDAWPISCRCGECGDLPRRRPGEQQILRGEPTTVYSTSYSSSRYTHPPTWIQLIMVAVTSSSQAMFHLQTAVHHQVPPRCKHARR
jgi:hypothetical protein